MSQYIYCKSSLKDYTNLKNTRVYFTANSLPIVIILLALIWIIGVFVLIIGLIAMAVIIAITDDASIGEAFLNDVLFVLLGSSFIIIFVYSSYILLTYSISYMKKKAYTNNCGDFVSEYISDHPI